jgi:hypothetical protein
VIDEVTQSWAGRVTDEVPARSDTSSSEDQTLETYTVYERFFKQSKQTLEDAIGRLGIQEIGVLAAEETGTIPEGIDPQLIPTLQPAFEVWDDSSDLRSFIEAA